MSLISKLSQSVVNKPVNRLFTGFEQLGAITRKPDTRTKEELVQTIDYYAQNLPEIKQFAKEIKQLNQKHMGTIADTLELSKHHDMLPTNINLAKMNDRGVSYRHAIVEDMIEASKTNPEAMELADAIINNTDSLTSKYVLASMSGGIMKNKELSKHMQETAKVIPDIAKETLNGGYLMDYSKQENFMDWLVSLPNITVYTDYFIFRQMLEQKNVLSFTTRLVQTYRNDGERIIIPLEDDGISATYWLSYTKDNKKRLKSILSWMDENALMLLGTDNKAINKNYNTITN